MRYTQEACIDDRFDDYGERRKYFFRDLYRKLADNVFNKLHTSMNPTYPISFVSTNEDYMRGFKRVKVELFVFTEYELMEHNKEIIREYETMQQWEKLK